MRLVFIPSTPTPFTGLVILVPQEDIYPIDIGVEEAVKLLVSGGIVSPPHIHMGKGVQTEGTTDASG
jgi:uncharacterized membrane protein